MLHRFINFMLSTRATTAGDINSHVTEGAIHKRFKQVETLAHELAYTTNGNATQKLIDEDGMEREYAVTPVVGTHAGLVCNILHGIDQNNPRVHVLFRGTHNAASIARNFETYGVEPGAISYLEAKEKILSTIKTVVAQKQRTCNLPIELSIAGHSLGSGDTQRCVTDLLENIATTPSCLDRISALNIMIVNPVGVAADTCKRCKLALTAAKNKCPELQVSYFPIFAEGDGIQQTGYKRILAGVDPTYVSTYLLISDHGLPKQIFQQAVLTASKTDLARSIGGMFLSHTAKVLNATAHKAPKFRVYCNHLATERVKIENELKNTVYKKLNRAFNPHKLYRKLSG